MTDNTLSIQVDTDVSGVNSGFKAVNDSIDALKQKSIEATQPTSQLFKTLESASDSAVKGILRGTETWHAAMLNVISDMEIKIAQLAVNDLLTMAKNQAQKLLIAESTDTSIVASNTAKNAAISASDATAANTSIASHAAQIISQIKSDAAATYAGVFAFMSPVMGPAAAIPAGVAAGTVAASEGLVSLDVGAWNLGSDMVAQLHQGEMVVPQTFAQGLRDGGGAGGGGDNYTINISAIDTQTGTQFLKNNASYIASALSSQVRNFNSKVPTWKS